MSIITKKLFIKTYGCQMNVYDSLRMQDILAPFGYCSTEEIDSADVVILNTCHIREKAAEKMYSELGRIKKLKDAKEQKMIIVVAGCVGQAEGEEIFERAPYVDVVVGPQSYHTLPNLITQLSRQETSKQKKHLIELDFNFEEKFDKLPEELTSTNVSSFISIQEGCDKFCTFCVVPYTRGAEFSRPLEQIYRETVRNVHLGAKEIYLLGQNVNAYHGKTPEGEDCSLAGLIQHLANIPNLERIRYTTSHPRDMTDELIKLHGTEKRLMPFLHLPVQSGSNKILQAMNRRHSRDEYLDIINRLRQTKEDIVLSSDFIVGFPGEDDNDFADTLDLVKKVRYGQCYSFKYSPRPGTPAALKPQIPENIKDERLAILQEELRKQQLEYNRQTIGKVIPVLFEKTGKLPNQFIGKTPYMQSVHIISRQNIIGHVLSVKINEAFQSSLAGILT